MRDEVSIIYFNTCSGWLSSGKNPLQSKPFCFINGVHDFCLNGSSFRNTMVECWLEMHPFIRLRAMRVATMHSASSSLHSSWQAIFNIPAIVANLMCVGWDSNAWAPMNKLRYRVNLQRSKSRYLGSKSKKNGERNGVRETYTPHLTNEGISCWRICSNRCKAPLIQEVRIGW